MRRSTLYVAQFIALFTAFASPPTQARDQASSKHLWASPIWIASPSFRRAKSSDGERIAFDNETVWQSLRVQADATRIRLRLSNELGDEPVEVTTLTVVAGSKQLPALFAGKPGVRLAPGEARVSDPVALDLRAFDQLSVGAYYASPMRPVAHRGHIVAESGRSVTPPRLATVRGPAIVSAIEALETVRPCGRIIVALGDSITEGVGAARGADWPSRLASRLPRQRCAARILNAGIGGNRLLSSGGSPSILNRLDRDVLALNDVTDIILLIGINDIRGWSTVEPKLQGNATDIIDGYRQIVARAHARGIRVIGGTILPHEGATNSNETTLALVRTINAASCSGAIFDATIDFASSVADPDHPDRLSVSASSGDWLHPSDYGYKRMAAAVPLNLLTSSTNRSRFHSQRQQEQWCNASLSK